MIRHGRINWILLIVCLVGITAVTLTFIGLRTWHRTNRSKQGFARGTQAFEQKDWENAAFNLGQYLSVNPQDVEILHKYAEALLSIRPLKRAHLDQAIRAYNQILRIEDNEQAAKRLLGIYLQRGDNAEVISLATDYLSRTKDASISLLLAEALIKQKNYTQAFERIQGILEQEPANTEAFQLMSILAEGASNVTDKSPIQWLSAAVETDPGHPRPYLYRAAYLQQHEDFKQALEDLNQAESLPYEVPDDRIRLATLLLMPAV